MNAQNSLILRRAILMQLEAASPMSLPLETVELGITAAGLAASTQEIAAAVDYLKEKQYVEISRSKICAAHIRVKLSATGRDYLESEDF